MFSSSDCVMMLMFAGNIRFSFWYVWNDMAVLLVSVGWSALRKKRGEVMVPSVHVGKIAPIYGFLGHCVSTLPVWNDMLWLLFLIVLENMSFVIMVE